MSNNGLFKRLLGLGLIALGLVVGAPASAVQIDFTGGTVTFNDGTTAVTNNSASYQNVASYEEDGFLMEFLFGVPVPSAFSSIAGDYYGTGNDVIHAHWIDNGNQGSGPFGELIEIRVSRVDAATFDLGGFRVSTNTAIGGDFSDGNELTWINSSVANEIFALPSDNWGLGSGPDPLVTIAAGNPFFTGISWFSFTNDALSSAVGLGLDNFFLNEAGDPDGVDLTPVPEPGILALLGIGLFGMGLARRRQKI